MEQVETGKLFEMIEQMPAFSSTVTKVISLANNPGSSPSDLVNTITTDPVLTAKLLKLINSAYFGLRQPVVSLHRAVIMLGFNTVKNVTLSISVAGTIKVKDNFKWFTRDEFWEHSLGCAVAAKALALRAGVSPLEVEEYFIGGLLHDIGKTLLIQAFAGQCEEIYDPAFQPGVNKETLEKKSFGVTHAELGGAIARHWKFPGSLVSAISGHHGAPDGGDDHKNLRLIVLLANHQCNVRKITTHPLVIPDSIPGELWSQMPLGPEEADESLEQLVETLEKAKVFLQVIDE